MTFSLEDVYRIIEHHETEPDRIVMVDVILYFGETSVKEYEKGSGLEKLKRYISELEGRGMWPDAMRIMIYPIARRNAHKASTYTQTGSNKVFDLIFTPGFTLAPYVPSLSGVRGGRALGNIQPAPNTVGLDANTLGQIRAEIEAKSAAQMRAELAAFKLELAQKEAAEANAKLERIQRRMRRIEREQQANALSMGKVLTTLGQLAPLAKMLLGDKLPITSEQAAAASQLAEMMAPVTQTTNTESTTTKSFTGYAGDDYDDLDDENEHDDENDLNDYDDE